MKCPECNSKVREKDLIPSVLTDSLLCCPACKGKSKHIAVISADASLVYNEANEKLRKRSKTNEY